MSNVAIRKFGVRHKNNVSGLDQSGETGLQQELKSRSELIDYIKLKLSLLVGDTIDDQLSSQIPIPYEVIVHLRERIRLSYGRQSPLVQRTQAFIDKYLADVPDASNIRLPGLGQTYILDRVNIAAELSVPEKDNEFHSDIISSYRLIGGQGVLHNPRSDRRTTQGVFHIAEGGYPIPEDKLAVPKHVFAKLLAAALNPPDDLLTLPYTMQSNAPSRTMLSLMTRPVVVPFVAGVMPEKTSEIEFLAPGNLVSNLDFIERIFGNAGDPHLPQNDAALDVEHWTGHTGYIILAPHLVRLTKKELGLPHIDQATERQKRDSMYWVNEHDQYNGGEAFKIAARNSDGVMITIIADNYFGYCKKEVKTQISYAANLSGMVEEEHAGGAIVYPQYDLGKVFSVPSHLPAQKHLFEHNKRQFSDIFELQPEGYGIDRTYPDIYYIPENTVISLHEQTLVWTDAGELRQLPLDPAITYIVPSGFKIRLVKEEDSGLWRLIGTVAEGTFCHKPNTVSGGGKSEISKSLYDAIRYGPFYTADFERDLQLVQELLTYDYSHRLKDIVVEDSRPLLSPKRSIGSVIKLLTPSSTLYTDEYNAWLNTIPYSVRQLLYIVKRFYPISADTDPMNPGTEWMREFSVDQVNGHPGHELKYRDEKLMAHFLRVGFTEDGNWRMFSLRSDFIPAMKLQQEDDITASIVVPSHRLPHLNPNYPQDRSYKLVTNAELRFFQRPDDAIHRGYDKLTEAHFAQEGNFLSNFEPLTSDEARAITAAPIRFAEFTSPMQAVILRAAKENGHFASSAHPRVINGKPSKNPRYLQIRPDAIDPKSFYIGEIGARLYRSVAIDHTIYIPVNAVLPGRRLNPPEQDAGIRSLAVYNPIHFQEAPELFMEFISSLTGKSPSTTGAGSEGALTKGPFNALLPIIDINNALVSHILTGTNCFVTAAGYVGPKYRVDHDISLLIPEVWSRMDPHEREPEFLIRGNFLEKLDDFEIDCDTKGTKNAGQSCKTILASRLGYRITPHFVRTFFGRVFDSPNDIFNEEMLKPELQDMESYIDGIDNIVSTQKKIAENYFADGSIEYACPPIRALLFIMKDGVYEGKDINHPDIRNMFTREYLLSSEWYRERLRTQQVIDTKQWTCHVKYIADFLNRPNLLPEGYRKELKNRLLKAEEILRLVKSPSYMNDLVGYLGADPAVLI